VWKLSPPGGEHTQSSKGEIVEWGETKEKSGGGENMPLTEEGGSQGGATINHNSFFGEKEA